MEEKHNHEHVKDLKAVIHFLTSLVDKHATFARHIDTQANILIGLSTGIFVLVATKILNSNESPFYLVTLMISSGISAILGLLTIHPPKFMRKRGQEESIMLYNKKIASFKSPKEYAEKLEELILDQDKLFKEFGLEIYNLSKYYYRPKRTLFVYARNLFIAGIAISIFILILNFL